MFLIMPEMINGFYIRTTEQPLKQDSTAFVDFAF